MKFLVISLLVFFGFTNSIWIKDFDQAKQLANTENKLILISFSGSDWCGPCIKLNQEVLESQRFVEFAKTKLVMVKADFPRLKKNMPDKAQMQKNEKLADKYNPKGKFPFTVLVDKSGKVLKEWEGYPKDLDDVKLRRQIEDIGL